MGKKPRTQEEQLARLVALNKMQGANLTTILHFMALISRQLAGAKLDKDDADDIVEAMRLCRHTCDKALEESQAEIELIKASYDNK